MYCLRFNTHQISEKLHVFGGNFGRQETFPIASFPWWRQSQNSSNIQFLLRCSSQRLSILRGQFNREHAPQITYRPLQTLPLRYLDHVPLPTPSVSMLYGVPFRIIYMIRPTQGRDLASPNSRHCRCLAVYAPQRESHFI